MGEYASYNGQEVKIGTCEDMYYLRFSQASAVRAIPNSVDPVRDAELLRFRFPFPDEDLVEPGAFEDYNRGIAVWGVKVPEGVEHHAVQFIASAGYNVCLPCPEAGDASHGLKVHRNEFAGPVRIVQQRIWEGKLVLVCQCGGCGAAYRLPTLEDVQPIVDQLEREATNARRDNSPHRAEWFTTIGARILAGYGVREFTSI